MKYNKRFIFVQIGIFMFLYIFFTVIVPIVPFDGDDWYFTGAMRLPIPLWGRFNPSKVLPEVLEPLGGYIAAFVIYPITRNYLRSINLVQAFIVTIFILIYLIYYYKYLTKRWKAKQNNALFAEIFLCLSFFCIFKKIMTCSITDFGH